MAKTMTIKQAASDAIAVQCACNLSGVVYAFKDAMDALNEEKRNNGGGTDFIRNHAICRLFAEQISHLTSGKDYYDASKECRELAGE